MILDLGVHGRIVVRVAPPPFFIRKARCRRGCSLVCAYYFTRTDCVARNLYDQSILVDQPAQVTAARELWLAQGGRLPIPFCGSLAKTLLPGGTTQNPYAQTHSGIRAVSYTHLTLPTTPYV